MKSRRLQKFVLSVGIILSLFASSLAACVCSHHALAAKAEAHAPSCHQTSHKSEETKAENRETKNNFSAMEESCNCLVKISEPVIVGKSENVKAQKILAILPAQIKIETFELTSKTEAAKIHLEYHFYNSNYLKRLTPPRAPPVL